MPAGVLNFSFLNKKPYSPRHKTTLYVSLQGGTEVFTPVYCVFVVSCFYIGHQFLTEFLLTSWITTTFPLLSHINSEKMVCLYIAVSNTFCLSEFWTPQTNQSSSNILPTESWGSETTKSALRCPKSTAKLTVQSTLSLNEKSKQSTSGPPMQPPRWHRCSVVRKGSPKR